METAKQQFCLHCKHIIRGRTDKKFCNDSCRNTFHNKTKATENNMIRNIKSILLTNRRILSETLGDKSTYTVHRSELVSKGFRFDFITHIHTNQKGMATYGCYDFSYKPITESSIQISKQKKI